MGSYDIFKQLTRGAKFTKSERKSGKYVEPLLTVQEIKIEEPDQLLDMNAEDEAGSTLNLSESLSTDSRSDGRKRKALEKLQSMDDKKIKLLHEEEVNRVRNALKIKVAGKRIPEPAGSFEDMNLPQDLLNNLQSCGYTEPTSIQKQAMVVMLRGRQLLACAPTGSGKTAAFLIPVINSLKGPQSSGFRAVVLCPTRELAKQTQRECIRLSEGRNFRIHILSKLNKTASDYGEKSSQKFDILITTPNRLCYLLQQNPPGISLKNVEWLIIDEADKLFEDSANSFRKQLKQVLEATTHPNRKIGMFSATQTQIVASWCRKHMSNLIRVAVGHRNAATNSVQQELLFVGNEAGKLLAMRNIIREGIKPPILVFVQSKERAQELFTELMFDGVNVDAIHGDRTQSQRDHTVKSYREGKVWILICTELMARGIDFKGVNLVINYDFPTSAISYVHRIGRAGRAGTSGKAISFFTVDDAQFLRKIAQIIKDSGGEVPDYTLKLKKPSKKIVKRLQQKAPDRKDISTKLHKHKKRKTVKKST